MSKKVFEQDSVVIGGPESMRMKSCSVLSSREEEGNHCTHLISSVIPKLLGVRADGTRS